MIKYFKYKLYNIFISPLFYVCALIFNFFVCGQFFFLQKFFSSAGTTDLHYFFHSIPLITSIILPVLKLNENTVSFDDCIPLKFWKKVLVSYLSLFIQFVLILLPQIFLPICVNLFGRVDAGQVFTGFFMLLLFGLVSCALCIFISQVLNSQNLAVIISILLFSIINGINLFSTSLINNQFYALLNKIFSFYWHFDAAEKGILDSRDIIYYIVVSLFLFYTTVYFAGKKAGKKLSSVEKRRFILITLSSIFLLLDSGRIYKRWDFTRDNKYSLTPYTKKLCSEISSDIRISYYQSKNLTNIYPALRDISDLLKEYSLNKNISLKIFDTDKNENSQKIEKYGIYARQIPVVSDNKTEYLNVYSAIILEYEDKSEIIPFILAVNTLEYDIDTKIINLIGTKKRIINILIGNGMSLQKDYSYLTPWLNSNSILVNDINPALPLENQLSYSKILLVLGSDKLNLNNCNEIIEYIEKGNSVIFALSPYTADIENNWYITKAENQDLIKMLEAYGFFFTDNLVADISCSRILLQSNQNEDGSISDSTYNQQINYPLWVNLLPQKNSKDGIILYWPSAIKNSDKTDFYLESSNMAWEVVPDNTSTKNLFETNPFIINEKKYPDIRERKALSLISKNKKLLLIPDQYFLNSLMLGYTGGEYGDYRNLDFITNQILKMNKEEDLAEIHEASVIKNNNSFYKTYNQELFTSAKNRSLFCMFILIPLLIIAAGIVFNYFKINLLKKDFNER